MKRIQCAGRAVARLLLLGTLLFTPVVAQAADDSRDDREAIRTGVSLEKSQEWQKAVRHYREAAEAWPDNPEIQYGLRRSKVHFSIARRYLDGSFETKLLPKSKTAALDLFDEVLSQVGSTYVEPVSATSFVAHGTESLYLALVNERFAAKHLRGVRSENIAEMRKILRDNYWNKPVVQRRGARQTVDEVCRIARNKLGLSPSAVVMEYVFGGCNALDDYSNVLTPHKLDDLYGNIGGEFVGLGIEMKAEPGKGLLLVNVLPNSPAREGGLKRNEHIVAIDGTDCRNMSTDAASKLLRGVSGSRVRLTIESADGANVRNRDFARRAVHIDSITVAEIIDSAYGVAYIQMNGFQKSSVEELDRALARLHRQGMRTLVWDLRGNPGGLLDTSAEVLDRFIDNGTLVSTRGRTRDQNRSYTANRRNTWSVPLVLLVDEDSASASEIVAGAIRDHGRGTIVGRKTYGKWSVQSIFPMNSQMGFRLTTAKFYSPKGENLAKVGVKPDVEVKDGPKNLLRYRAPKSEAELAADPDLHKAVEILREKYAKR